MSANGDSHCGTVIKIQKTVRFCLPVLGLVQISSHRSEGADSYFPVPIRDRLPALGGPELGWAFC